jgi:Fur family iron response transcriptional regulator
MPNFRLSLIFVKREAVIEKLRQHGVSPSAQRLAVAEHVLMTDAHPSADEVFAIVKRGFPMISRATVYNTLNLFVEKGLLRELVLAEGRIVFDPKVDAHHHFVDEESGAIRDIPWEKLTVAGVDGLSGVDVREYQVVLRGKLKARRRTTA